MHCSLLEIRSCLLVQATPCWCFSWQYQEALSWQYFCSQLLLQGLMCLLSKWKKVSFFFFWYLYCYCIWGPYNLHYLEVQNASMKYRDPSQGPPCVFMSSLELAWPGELLGWFLLRFWPKSTTTLLLPGKYLGALWGWDHFPQAGWNVGKLF